MGTASQRKEQVKWESKSMGTARQRREQGTGERYLNNNRGSEGERNVDGDR